MIQVMDPQAGLRNINLETITDRRQENYFRDLREMLAYAFELGQLTRQFFSTDFPDKTILAEMRSLEFRNNELSLRVLYRLYKHHITPFDSREMEAFINNMGRISEILLNAAERIDLYEIRRKVKYADELMNIVNKQISLLEGMISNLPSKRTGDGICIHELGEKADKIYDIAMREILATESNMSSQIKRKEIIELLERASDQCEVTSDIIVMGFYKFL